MRIQPGRTILLAAVVVVLMATPAALSGQDLPQKTFATPEAAVKALSTAASAGDTSELQAIFGPDSQPLFSSGDPVADRNAREVVVVAIQETWRLEGTKAGQRTLYIGNEDWPFPVPLVKAKSGWRFDTAAGVEEVRFRRIGRNELKVIQVCSTIVEAQREYASEGHDGKPAGLYAQKLASDPGKQDGLYWKAAANEPLSPLGDLAAEAAEQGYTREEGKRTPFHGYLFRILTAQGKSAPGGAGSFLVNGEMLGGFAILAWPAEYGKSGIMTFLVSHYGVLYETDLGPDTAKRAGEIQEFDPGKTWQRVR